MIATETETTFAEMLKGDRFCYGAELVTTRGTSERGETRKTVELGEALAQDPRLAWLSITDNPGGRPMLPADWLARMLASRRTEIVIHMTCKDLNRNGLEAAAWRCASEDFHNILALTGDYPTTGYGGLSRPVFDLDSVGLLALLRAMNDGLTVPGRSGAMEVLPPTRFFIGCTVCPFKQHERELMPQFFKLGRKIRCGAQWVIPQLGYDMRKFQEVRLFMDWAGLRAPVLGNVYVLNKTVAGLFHDRCFPGCVVSDELYDLSKRYARYSSNNDGGRNYFHELAAKQLAVFKGLGFAAGYLAGISRPESFARIIDLSESFAEDDWMDFAREIQFSRPDEFYLFEQDSETRLSDGARLNRTYLESLRNPPRTRNVSTGYRLSRRAHELMFRPDTGLFIRLRQMHQRLESKGGVGGAFDRALHRIERVSKHLGYGCTDCGDCSLPDCAHLCPSASCSKRASNGPCGGSFDGRCELDDKECLWARAYERLKFYGESEHMLNGPAIFTNASLQGTSSWANLYLGRDHHQITVNGCKPVTKRCGAEQPAATADSSAQTTYTGS